MFFPAPSRVVAETLGNLDPKVPNPFSCLGYERELTREVYGSESQVMSNPQEIESGWKLKKCKKASENAEIKSAWKLKKCKKASSSNPDPDPEVMKLPSDSEHDSKPDCRKRKRKKVDLNSGWKPKLDVGHKLKGRFMKRFLSNRGKTTHLVRFNKREGEVERVGFDFLKGKYLLICYFTVPMCTADMDADVCHAIIDAYDDLSQDPNAPPFEMVVVANMRDAGGSYDQKAAFDHFYSAFSCLAIPFSDFETRDYICSCMKQKYQHYYCILVSPEGLILQAGYDCFDRFLKHGGSEWAPFLNSTLDSISFQDKVLRLRLDPLYRLHSESTGPAKFHGYGNLSLYRDILLCDPNLILHRFVPETNPIVSTVLDLSYKYVGLYLCFNGSILKDIKAAHDNCLAKNQQLEIVLVCMSVCDQPESFYKDLYEGLRLFDVKSWFLFDYNSKVCRRLFRIFKCCYLDCYEKFVIIPPHCESGEVFGGEVITKLGIDEYPFTRSSILKRKLECIRSFTPALLSLFDNCVFQNGVKVKAKKLRAKNVLLYVADEMWWKSDLYARLKLHYVIILNKGWEVVCVPWVNVSETDARCDDFDLDEMPWPYMSPHAAAKVSIRKLITFPPEEEEKLNEEDEKEKLDAYVVAVRKDGRIVSRNIADRLRWPLVTKSLFADRLEKELDEKLYDIVTVEKDWW